MEIKCGWCGKSFEYKGGKAHYNRSKEHYCSRECQNVKHGLARRKETDHRYKMWCGVKKRAKKKNIDFALKIEDIPEIPKTCPIFGILIKPNGKSGPSDNSPSLDRITPKKGYIPENIRIVSNRANRLRQDATIEELNLLVKDAKNIQSKS